MDYAIVNNNKHYYYRENPERTPSDYGVINSEMLK